MIGINHSVNFQYLMKQTFSYKYSYSSTPKLVSNVFECSFQESPVVALLSFPQTKIKVTQTQVKWHSRCLIMSDTSLKNPVSFCDYPPC